MATAPVAMATITTVDGSGTAVTVISPPVIFGVRTAGTERKPVSNTLVEPTPFRSAFVDYTRFGLSKARAVASLSRPTSI